MAVISTKLSDPNENQPHHKRHKDRLTMSIRVTELGVWVSSPTGQAGTVAHPLQPKDTALSPSMSRDPGERISWVLIGLPYPAPGNDPIRTNAPKVVY